jgi:hypothetical protein
MGEFEGEDAATACQAKILAEHQQPEVIHFNQGNPVNYDANKMPLETLIEGELPRHDYYLSVQMGRQFFKLMNSAGLSGHKKAFITQYPIAAIKDTGDNEAMYLFQSTSGAFPDGYKIWEDINDNKFESFIKTIPGISAGDTDKFIQVVASQFSKWFTNLYHLPAVGQTSWRPDRMEYNFELDLPHVESGTQSFLEATQYSSGKIDWLTFDENLKEAPEQLPADNFAEVVQSFIPTALKYAGMPNPRFWQMENSRVDFGKIQTGTS